MKNLLLAASLIAAPTVAQASWQKVSSPHFVIYADQAPDKLRDFATRLERFDKAVRLARGTPDQQPSDGNRVTIYMVGDLDEVQKLYGLRDKDVAGFYIARATGSIAVIPKTTGEARSTDLAAEEVFLHEYAHHLMFQSLDQPLPKWLVEGFAEFYSTARFGKDGSVTFGGVPQMRARSILSPLLSTEDIVGASAKSDDPMVGGSLYARGWLLVHYLTFEPSRHGQADRYVALIAGGKTPMDAAREAFGDLKQLGRELDNYALRKQLSGLTVNARNLPVGRIDVGPISEGAVAAMPLRLKLERGRAAGDINTYLAALRGVAGRYPGDLLAETTLSKAELILGNHDAAEAAADRALAANPQSGEAMMLKGRAIMARAAKPATPDLAALDKARKLFIAANKLDKEDPEPLMWYYRTYRAGKQAPTANANAALHYASDLAPFDRNLRLESGIQYIHEKNLAEARKEIAPLTYDPHDKGLAERAKKLVDLIDAGAKAKLPDAAPSDAN